MALTCVQDLFWRSISK